jgi:undecaprenyl-diphosphatase
VQSFFRSLFMRGPWNSTPGGRLADSNGRLAWALILGTLPAVVIGFLFEDVVEALVGTPLAVGGFMLVTAAILALSERLGRRNRPLAGIGLVDSLVVGLAQAAALAPGLSRSGATISAGLARGFTRESAARFSFLLSTPVIFGAGVLQLFDLVRGAEVAAPSTGVLVVGTLTAAVVGYLCIRFLLSYLRRGTLYPFAVYCAVVGLIVIIANLS